MSSYWVERFKKPARKTCWRQSQPRISCKRLVTVIIALSCEDKTRFSLVNSLYKPNKKKRFISVDEENLNFLRVFEFDVKRWIKPKRICVCAWLLFESICDIAPLPVRVMCVFVPALIVCHFNQRRRETKFYYTKHYTNKPKTVLEIILFQFF